ncbi:MAG TPA: GTP cyclohydrolase FolE2 [Spirochaetia bacterium]|nr:GTP cyclohydrolase FolE2 [Spirochaetia bacterium]
MTDVQGSRDERNIPLQKVGVKNLRYPITVLDRANRVQHTTATVHLFADLPHHFKGTHMSRFIEVFNQYYQNLGMPRFLSMLDTIRDSLEAEDAFAEVTFPYFIEKSAPVTGEKSQMEYTCRYIGQVSRTRRDFYVGVRVPVLTLCPCSKEISDRGAHNQRGFVTVRLKLGPFFWIEDIIELIEQSASGGLFTLLKREDEKFVTEFAYDHPVFVEDLVREVCVRIERFADFPWFSVEAENAESIHNHDAYAYAERGNSELRLAD